MTRIVCLLAGRDYKPGDPPPDGYLAWHEWAEVQHKAGLRQRQCLCGKWVFPQEACCPTVGAESRAVVTKTMRDPYGDNRPVHLAAKVGEGGRISPLCAKRPRALPSSAKWTTQAAGVTCPRCLAALEASRP